LPKRSHASHARAPQNIFGGRFYRHNRRSGALVSMPRGRGGNYFAAYQRWPKAKITLRQGARVVEKNWL
jgi:hypothetical protein